MASSPITRRLAHVLAFAAGGLLFARVIIGVDVCGTARALASAGPAVLLLLVPFAIAMALDTCGILLLGRAVGVKLPAAPTWRVRLFTEAIRVAAPGGAVASDAVAVRMLASRCGASGAEATIVTVARKRFIMVAHSAYLVVGALVGWASLSVVGRTLHVAPLCWFVLASAAVPLATSVGLGFALSRSPLVRALSLFARLPRLRARIERAHHAFDHASECLDRLARASHTTALATLVFLAGWLLDAVETALALRVLGVPLPIGAVLAVETCLSLARSAAAIVPGGLGVQDLGYATALVAVGVAPETATAFVVLKRGRDLVCVAVGTLAGMVGRWPASRAFPSAHLGGAARSTSA